MGQVTIYLEDGTEEKARAAAHSQGVSLSKWIAGRITQGTRSEWPTFAHELAGAWADLPSAEQIRKRPTKDVPRRRL
jgi:hypothetical protein